MKTNQPTKSKVDLEFKLMCFTLLQKNMLRNECLFIILFLLMWTFLRRKVVTFSYTHVCVFSPYAV